MHCCMSSDVLHPCVHPPYTDQRTPSVHRWTERSGRTNGPVATRTGDGEDPSIAISEGRQRSP